MSFSSLSKNQAPYSSDQKLNRSGSKASKSSFNLPPKHENNVRKRLDFDQNMREESKENKLNFTNIIRTSKEKSLKGSSLFKNSSKKIIKPPLKKSNHLNQLKARLIG